MTGKELKKIIEQGENISIEFKSWKRSRNMKERINLAVPELIAFANAKGGGVFFGIEDDGQITGCQDFDLQNIVEAIYDKTTPPLFVNAETINYEGKDIIMLQVEHDGNIYATTDGRCLKRLGKNSKPWYPREMGSTYSTSQGMDFSAKVIVDSSLEDIDRLAVYQLKEKLKIRDGQSTLSQMEDIPFLRDLELIKSDAGQEKLSIAGLLFVGKESAIQRLLPQAEVIYLHYNEKNLTEYDSRIDMKQPIITILDRLTEKIQNEITILNVQIGLFRQEIPSFSIPVFQEALLNAMAHRDYQNPGAIYVKQYPDRLVIESPGGLPEDITKDNIITHPSVPRNKLIAETLQRLKYVQRTGQGVDIIFRDMISMGKPFPEYQVFTDAVILVLKSANDNPAFVKFIIEEQEQQEKLLTLAELMTIRYVYDNKNIKLHQVCELTQLSNADAKKCCFDLVKLGILESAGKEYMFTERVYHSIKSEVEYVQDRTVNYIKARGRILDYLEKDNKITNETVRRLCNVSRVQAGYTLKKMVKEEKIKLVGKGRNAYYQLM